MGSLPASSGVGEAGYRRWRRRRFEGGSQLSLRWRKSMASLSYGGGRLRPNSGERGCNRRGEVVVETQEGEGMLMV